MPSEALRAIETLLDDPDQCINHIANQIHRCRFVLSVEGSDEDVAEQLNNEDESVRLAALGVLQSKSDLPDDILQVVLAKLVSEEEEIIWKAAEKTVQNQSSLSDKIACAMVDQLENLGEQATVNAVVEILCKKSSSSNEIVRDILDKLKSNHTSVRLAAL